MDINGLRAIAVMMVAIYHFKYQFGYGGYAGVDVFFVISGFLMNEIYRKSAPFWAGAMDFYSRRLNRIYPALAFFSAATFLLLLPFSAPSALSSVAREVLAALTFTSNIFYWKSTSGYFGAAADSFSLLHTWSLSLEWQFYIFFPLIIFSGNIFRRIIPLWAIYLLLAVGSLVACLILAPRFQNPAFYLLPTRAWELLIGAFASAVPLRNRFPRLSEVTGLIGIVLFFLVSKSSVGWPGPWTLVPTISAALLLHANIGNERSFLRFQPFQKLGNSSYSIYLAHWPIAHLFHVKQIAFTPISSGIGLVISVILGMAGHHFIERRFRPRFLSMIAIGLVIIATAFLVSKLELSKHWLPKQVIELDSYANYVGTTRHRDQFGNLNATCFLSSSRNGVDLFDDKCIPRGSKPRLLILGDSHAAQLSRSLKDEFTEFDVSQVTASGCLPVPSSHGAQRCTELMNKFYNEILPSTHFDIVLVTAHWFSLAPDIKPLPKLIASATDRLSMNAGQVYVIGQTKVYDHPLFKLLQVGADPASHEVEGAQRLNDFLAKTFATGNTRYLNVYELNCKAVGCSYIDDKNEPFMFDDNHLTPGWAAAEAKLLRELMREEIAPSPSHDELAGSPVSD
ncbi:acyltransferase family protein [Stenotrophomonas tumulicola]|uniref:Acyltransferase n=1 Tax=Stenotrophomonas tumulicola TaxID=1685415 RepID=A0A7W3IIW9_9GAMM|nr:acyltransferase family protein [Stenotrophomonas tumulicola]MBA8683543.1 acyltransferase [Stenotrophomonas tumulicola]